ncbi:hypothetical protein [Oceanobacillus polygoni]|uniref:Lipopolysaccharide export system protein LptC n=1 Tax=Oceanobacillus polygoni TaxID=1235259 RepID=A0A9X0YVL3_9BACI|nr:hypothetical protein [Oceanobacillus polygoni]MBP2078140.1 lipopolysaccharide export system protein LptC [Oceanobacillus polygoni]
MRFIVILLLLAVFFLSGIVYGMNQEEPQAIDNDTAVVDVIEDTEEQESSVETVTIPVSQPMADADAPAQYTQKTASILGAGVKGFFELLMQVLYQTAQLFF